MDSYSAISPPNSASSTGTKRSKFFLPLSNHGMPKTPAPISPGGSVKSNRFLLGRARSNPNSPGTPPMSAKSFATLIDDEAPYSPNAMRAMTHLDAALDSNGSTLVSASTTPSIPPIPKFDDIEIVHAHRRTSKHITKSPQTSPHSSPRTSPRTSPHTSPKNSPGAAPFASPLLSLDEKLHEKENVPPKPIEKVNDKPLEKVEEADITALPQPLASPTGLGRLTSRMRSVLRPKKSTNKKIEKERKSKEEELDRMEDVHWTEM